MHVICLTLEEGKYWVGLTRNPEQYIEFIQDGKYPLFLEEYPYAGEFESHPLDDRDFKSVVEEYKEKFGEENVASRPFATPKPPVVPKPRRVKEIVPRPVVVPRVRVTMKNFACKTIFIHSNGAQHYHALTRQSNPLLFTLTVPVHYVETIVSFLTETCNIDKGMIYIFRREGKYIPSREDLRFTEEIKLCRRFVIPLLFVDQILEEFLQLTQ